MGQGDYSLSVGRKLHGEALWGAAKRWEGKKMGRQKDGRAKRWEGKKMGGVSGGHKA